MKNFDELYESFITESYRGLTSEEEQTYKELQQKIKQHASQTKTKPTYQSRSTYRQPKSTLGKAYNSWINFGRMLDKI